jgi:hypothetical protein
MPRVHKKVAHKEAQKILNNQSLLSEDDRHFVEQIRNEVKLIQKEALPLVQARLLLNEEYLLHEQATINVRFALQAVTDAQQDLSDGYNSVTQTLNTLLPYAQEKILNFGDIESVDDLRTFFNIQSIELESEESRQKVIAKLKAVVVDEQANVFAADVKSDLLQENLSKMFDSIGSYSDKIAELQTKLGAKFEVDGNFELTKISKGKKGPEFSVIFTHDEGMSRPFILYRGKEYEGKVRQLGEGGFGKVKLAQDYVTNELVAVKVQLISHLPEHVLQKEKRVLKEMDHFKGTVQRTEKDYIVQALHYGSELESLIKEGELSEIASLNMLKGAAVELQKMHDKNKIHRDIKLENFIWDNVMSKCVLIDFAFVENIQDDEIIHFRDEAGSEAYLSPEAQEGNYSKRSDIYAFGIMMKEVLEKHPSLYEKLQNEISKLTIEKVEDRANSLGEVINKLSSLQAQAIQKIYPNRTPAVSNQRTLLLKELKSKHLESIERDLNTSLTSPKKPRQD